MAKLKVINLKGEKVEDLKVSDTVFKTEVKPHLIQMEVRSFLNSKRSGTASNKGRSSKKGSGKKIYRQKGTGNARMGQRRTVIRRGGGVAFEKNPRDFSFKVNKKSKKNALRSALSDRMKSLTVLDKLEIKKPKTKQITDVMNGLKFQGKTLIVVSEPEKNLELSVRNLPTTMWVTQDYLNCYYLLYFDNILFTKDAVKKLDERLSK